MLPPYVTVTGSGLALWLYMQMLQLALPAELVVAEHFWAELPRAHGEGHGLTGQRGPARAVSGRRQGGGLAARVEVLPV